MTSVHLVILATVIFGQQRTTAETEGLKELTVCEVFEHLQSYRDKLVQVSGRLYTSRHGWILSQQGCAKAIVVRGLRWPTTIDVIGPHLGEPPATFHADEAPMKQIDEVFCFLNNYTQEELGIKITVSFVGELRTRKEYGPPVNPSGQPSGLGFGHMGASPAQLVIRDIARIVIQRTVGPQ
jgi:hypothetical protein